MPRHIKERMYALMVVIDDFPEGDAGAVRDMAFAKLFQEMGYRTILVGMGKGSSEGETDGVTYHSVYRPKESRWDGIRNYLGYQQRSRKYIKEIIEAYGLPSLIYMNGIPENAINALMRLAKSKDIPLVYSSTEWYSPCEFKRGKWDKSYIMNNRLNQTVIRRQMKVVAISEYMTEHFRQKGLSAIRIPAMMDVRSIQTEERTSDPSKVNMIYAGSPGSKDCIKEMIWAVRQLTEEETERLSLHIFGISKEQMILLAGPDSLLPCIKIYGRTPREKVLAAMQSMDFALLLRPEGERYAQAGFPTKSVESMAHGVAMICNLTSDLGMYLKDDENAIIVSACTVDAMTEALRKALSKKQHQIDAIKRNARRLAESHFDYRVYRDAMQELLDEENPSRG